MKKIFSLLLVSLFLASGVLYVQQQQHTDYDSLTARSHALHQELIRVEEDIRFLKKNSQQIDFLTKKGWILPHSRLSAAEKIHHIAHALSSVHFTFEPETMLTTPQGDTFRVTKIILVTTSVLDSPICDFMATLLKTFPGVLLLRKFSLSRHPPFIHGEITLEWFALAEEEDNAY
jgi:hypothetical protein